MQTSTDIDFASISIEDFEDDLRNSLEMALCGAIVLSNRRGGNPAQIVRAMLRQVISERRRKRRPLSFTQKMAIFKRDDYKCVRCGAGDNLSVDHIIPFARGGADDESNMQTLCCDCNFRKGAK